MYQKKVDSIYHKGINKFTWAEAILVKTSDFILGPYVISPISPKLPPIFLEVSTSKSIQ